MVELHGKSTQNSKEISGPLKPGTPLYRLLTLVAKRVASDLREEARARKTAVRD